jgi:glutathione S-transferase
MNPHLDDNQHFGRKNMITLHHFERSGNAREVRIALHEKNLSFEEVMINVMEGDTRKPEFLKLNPFGKVPVLVDQTDGKEIVLYEASIINYYLDEKYPDPPLMPKEAMARGEVRKWVYWGTQKTEKHLAPVLLTMLLKKEDQWDLDMIDQNKKALGEALEVMDRQLKGKEYLCGDYSLADVCLTPHLAALGRIKYTPDPKLKNYHQWMKRLKSRSSFKASISH